MECCLVDFLVNILVHMHLFMTFIQHVLCARSCKLETVRTVLKAVKEVTNRQMSKAINSYQVTVLEVSASGVCGTFHAE